MAYELDFMVSYNREHVAAELARVAEKLGKRTLTWADINENARVTAISVKKKFGSMQMAHRAAGLVPPRDRLSNEEILGLLDDLWKVTHREKARSPSVADLKVSGLPIGLSTIVKRFGSWNKALAMTAETARGKLKAPKPRRAWVERSPRQPTSVNKRFMVFKRDGYRCRMCGQAGGELEADHVIPVCRGGRDILENLQTLCRRCNRGKSGNLE